jgi:hypothetical protein
MSASLDSIVSPLGNVSQRRSADIRSLAKCFDRTQRFRGFARKRDGPAIIAELKRRLVKGLIRADFRPAELRRTELAAQRPMS